MPASSPAVAALIAVVRLRERPGVFSLAAAAGLATAGVLACTADAPAAAADGGAASTTVGDLLVLAAVLCEGFFILLNKRLSVPMSAPLTSSLMAGMGLALSLMPALFERLGRSLRRRWAAWCTTRSCRPLADSCCGLRARRGSKALPVHVALDGLANRCCGLLSCQRSYNPRVEPSSSAI